MLTNLLYEKTVKCIACHHTFKTMRMKSNSVRVTVMDSDFCPHYESENPLFYDVNVCPQCGLAFTDSFSAIRPAARDLLQKEYLDKIRVPKLDGQRLWAEALRSYELAFLSSQILQEKLLVQANLALRIAWMFRYQKKEQEERRFMQIAANVYIKMYETQEYDTEVMPDDKLMYIIGELCGRLQQWDKTRVWFSHLFMNNAADQKWRSRARDRWMDFKGMQQSAMIEDPDGYVGNH